MPAVIDITDQRFGRLTVIQRSANCRQGQARWLCKCDCGNLREVESSHLRRGQTQSCGCLARELLIKRSLRHGHARDKTPTYLTWKSMFRRCTTPTDPAYSRYGGRGIHVCKRWYKFENFLADMGERPPGKSIDRINNDEGYSPQNCRWATALEQTKNRRFRSPASRGK
jgi:hypothetical protein